MPADGLVMHGLDELIRRFDRMEDRQRRKALRRPMRATMKQVKANTVANVNWGKVGVDSGNLLDAVKAQKIRVLTNKKGVRVEGVPLPTRAELGIDPTDKHFYPAALEYGTPTIRPRRMFRDAIDEHIVDLRTLFATQLGPEIERVAMERA